MTGWFWRRRDHGFRNGVGPRCGRCGGFEYGDPRHPRGYWVVKPKGWLR